MKATDKELITRFLIKRIMISILIYGAAIILFLVIANFTVPVDIERSTLEFDSGIVTETWVYKGPSRYRSDREYRYYFSLDNGKQYYMEERAEFLSSIELDELEGRYVTVGYSEYADYVSDKHDGFVAVDIASDGVNIVSVEELNKYVSERYWRNRIGWTWGIFILLALVLVFEAAYAFFCFKLDLNVGGPMLTPKKNRNRPKKQYENKRRKKRKND